MKKNISFSEEEMTNFHKSIGKNVSDLRKKNNLTQLDLAYMLGHKSSAFISHAEINLYGKHFNIDHIYKISKAFDVEIHELIKISS